MDECSSYCSSRFSGNPVIWDGIINALVLNNSILRISASWNEKQLVKFSVSLFQGAEQRVVASYLLEVEDVDERLAAALKIKCHLAVVDAFASAKDRRGLEEYAKRLGGEEGLQADLLLKNPNIKWKN